MALLGAVIFAFIITLLKVMVSLRDNKNGESKFFTKFTGTLLILISIIIIGTLSEKFGCSSEEEPDYPMKYNSNQII